jgi:hypothetical protein
MIPSTLKGHDTGGFLGVNLRQDRLRLADGDVARAINADLHTQPGTIMLRLGRARQFDTAFADLTIRQLVRYYGGARYRAAGNSLYRNETAIYSGLSGELVTTMVPFRPLNDTTTYMFIADQSRMQKDSGTALSDWGVAAPSTKPTVATGASTGLTGAYSFRYTYIRKVGGVTVYESNPSPVSDTVNPVTQDIAISGLIDSTDSTITHKRIYRTTGDATTYLFDQDIATGTTTGTSSQGDTALGGEVETDNDQPPEASWCFSYLEHMFLLRDEDNPHFLWWSKRYQPESVPAENFIEIGHPQDPLQCGVSYGGLAGVFSRLTKYRILGNTTSGFVHQEAMSKRGTPAFKAVVASEHGIIFPALDGIFVTQLVSPDTEVTNEIEPLFFGETVNGFYPINWGAASQFTAAVFKGRYYLSYADTRSQTPNMLMVYSFDTKRWYFYDHPLSSFFVEEDRNVLTAGTQTGFVIHMETGSDDEGEDIAMEVETRDYAGEEGSNILKLYQFMRVDADTLGESVNVDLYLDDTRRATLYISHNGRSSKLYSLPPSLLGYKWRAKARYTGTARVRIYSAGTMYVPLSAA